MPLIRRETPDQAEVGALLAAADERSASLYPLERRHGLTPSELLSAHVRFFVARDDDQDVLGCGGYIPLPEHAAEMKRLFVPSVARGRGVGALLVQAIEHAAVGEGVKTLFLETGIKSFEALCLYRSRGYMGCDPFGAYQPDPLSIFMCKRLSP